MAFGLTPRGSFQAVIGIGSRQRPGWAALSIVGLALVLAGCGRVPASGDASAARTGSPTPPLASPSPSGTWQVYADQQYGFSISYPRNFTFLARDSGLPEGIKFYRAVETRYANDYPPGQVEIYTDSMDAASLAAWITKHTGPAEAPESQAHYFTNTSNVTTTTLVGRQAISFEYSVTGFPAISHSIVFLQTSARVFLISWWSADPQYTATISAVFEQMLTSLRA
jgi:hypothetical protein